MLDSRQTSDAGSPRPSVILRPGIAALPPGVERYRVRGSGSVTVRIFAGDEITLTDLEGLQPAVLAAVDASGRPDAGILGIAANSGTETVTVFGEGSRAGEQARFTATRDGI